MSRPSTKKAALLALAATAAETAVVARKRGFLFGVRTVVRCRSGHLFTTLWVPGASLKALRFGPWRVQRCPVGKHWTVITPVKVASLSVDDRALAAARRDSRIP